MAYTKLVTFALVAIVFCMAVDAATTVNTHPVHKKVVRPAQQVAAATQEGDVTKGVQPAATAGEKIAAILGLTPEGGETLVRLSIKMKPLAAEYAPKIYAAMRSMITSYFK